MTQFLPESYGPADTEGLGMGQLFLQAFRRVEEGEDNAVVVNSAAIITTKSLIEESLEKSVWRKMGDEGCAIFGNADILLTQGCFQPEFPAFPWGQIYIQWNVNRTGR